MHSPGLYSDQQLESERLVAEREGYDIDIVKADTTQPLPFADESFDMIIQPVANCYVEKVKPIWKECYRVLKKGGVLLVGLDNGINYLFDSEDEKYVVNSLPFNPLKNPDQMQQLEKDDFGVQFSHTLEEQIGDQLEAFNQSLWRYQRRRPPARIEYPDFYRDQKREIAKATKFKLGGF